MSYNNYNFNPQAMVAPQQIPATQQNIQPLFPQPQGNVYNINSTLEVANVPVGAGISVALCIPENIMYIKTMQNGNPLFYPYKILPFNQNQEQKKEENLSIEEQLNKCNERIKILEEQLIKITKKGDDWEV